MHEQERHILVIESDKPMRQHLIQVLHVWECEAVTAGTLDEAMAALAGREYLFTLLDLHLDSVDGLEFLRRLRVCGGSPGAVVVLGRRSAAERAMEALALGADEFVQDPFSSLDLENAIRHVLSRPRRVWFPGTDKTPLARVHQEMALWRSQKMQEVCRIIQPAAQVDVTVLIQGETGTGKDVVARAIHYLSARRARPFVKVNCAAVPRDLIESELFGHERGAFTGAHQLKIGKFEAADQGTIFLDEIGDLDLDLQAKLLHVLQDGEFSRVGGKSTVNVDARVVAATNQDLEKAVAEGRFREDLYYRLNVIQINLPPLRERPEEIPLLAEYFMQHYAKRYRKEGTKLSPEIAQRLMRHRYPGNVRELESIIKRMIVLGDPLLTRFETAGANRAPSFGAGALALPAPARSLKDIGRAAARAAEHEAILRALQQTHWNRVKAARLLTISYRALLYKIKEGGLDQQPRP